jgi:hypothetical protein
MQPIIRSYTTELDHVDESKRTIGARINVRSIDRYRSVIEPDGGDFADFLRNPVVLLEHGLDPTRGMEPIGTSTMVKAYKGPRGPEIRAITRFHRDDEKAERLFRKYASGEMKGWSIHAQPVREACGRPTRDELRTWPALKDCDVMYRKWKLLEYSAVAVPGNSETLTLEEARSVLSLEADGIWLKPELVSQARSLLAAVPVTEPETDPELPQLRGRTFEQHQAELLRRIKAELDPSRLRAELDMRADYRKGIV